MLLLKGYMPKLKTKICVLMLLVKANMTNLLNKAIMPKLLAKKKKEKANMLMVIFSRFCQSKYAKAISYSLYAKAIRKVLYDRAIR
ncbi:hypothetical protein M0802_011333 [Mischocyttarus mexicanus]|nr:hypothetical protein M0802_011333 [Mischocyttarus mexicanus]